MVAAAGSAEVLHPAIGLALVAATVIGLIVLAALGNRAILFNYVPMQRSLDSLEDRAREVAGLLGYGGPGHDSARGLQVNYEYLSYITRIDDSQTRWQVLKSRDVPVMLFWYRSSPDPLVPLAPEWTPLQSDPPSTIAGMTAVVLDDAGRLVEFRGVPPLRDTAPNGPADGVWSQLFTAAALPFSEFRPTEPELVPRGYADERAAWEGPLRQGSAIRVKAEAASYRGRAVFFRVTGPWTPTERAATSSSGRNPSVWRFAGTMVGLLLLAGSIALARSNLRAGRGDLRGAARISLFCLAVWLFAWTIGASHYHSLDTERARLFTFLGVALFQVTGLFLLYVSLEPYVRRFSPGILMSWSRVLTGQIVDPLVGKDTLVGVVVGVGIVLWILALVSFAPAVLGEPPWTPRAPNLRLLLDHGIAAGAVFRMVPNAVNNAMGVAVVFVVGRAIFRRVWAGALCAGLVLGIALMGETGSSNVLIPLLLNAGFVIPMIAVLLYCGMLSLAVAFFVGQVLNNAPLTLDLSAPHASGALWAVFLVVGLTLFGYYASRKGQPLFGRLLD